MRQKTIVLVLSCFALGLTISPRVGASDSNQPPKRFVDVGACPFECCTYRQWTVRDSVDLFDRPNGKRVVATLRKDEIVKGLTGEVISRPVAVKANREIPATPIKAGDTFYVLHYDGEGYWKAWYRGKTTFVHQSVIDIAQPTAKWWVKVEKDGGGVGWTLSNQHFLHQDACE